MEALVGRGYIIIAAVTGLLVYLLCLAIAKMKKVKREVTELFLACAPEDTHPDPNADVDPKTGATHGRDLKVIDRSRQ